jgi:hypothetical protein
MAGEARSDRQPVKIVDRSATSTARRAPCCRAVAKRFGTRRPAEDTITVKLTGTAGQSFGAFLRAASRSSCRRQATTMSARACRAARIIVRPPDQRVQDRRASRSSSATRDALRRDEGECLFARRRRRALRGAQLGRHRRRRRHRRPWLRVHDRRQSSSSSAKTGRNFAPACPAASPMCWTRPAISPSAATWRWSSSSRFRKRRSDGKAAPPWRRPRPQGPRRRVRRHDQP